MVKERENSSILSLLISKKIFLKILVSYPNPNMISILGQEVNTDPPPSEGLMFYKDL
jgi:hypothetical protein